MKKLTILAAMHGDEVYGIELFNECIKKYPEYTDYLQLIIGNELAYRKARRFIDSDMNRHYDDTPQDHESSEMNRVDQLIRSFQPDYILDIHTTRRDSGVFFISDQPNDARNTLFRMLPIDVCVMQDAVIRKSFIGNYANAVSLEYSLNKISEQTTDEFVEAVSAIIQEKQTEKGTSKIYNVSKLITKSEWESYPGIKNYDSRKEGTALMVPADITEMDAEYYGFWCHPSN